MPSQSITFTCEIITPMFLGNAIPGQCELRPSAIKGALRFWWRAMNGNLPLQALKKEEAKIFGGLPQDEKNNDKIGRSNVEIIVVDQPDKPFQTGLPTNERAFTTMYAGTRKRNGTTRNEREFDVIKFLTYGANERPYFPVGAHFSFVLKFKDQALRKTLINIVSLMGAFGGLGAKSRNGFGRFSFNIDDVTMPELSEILKDLRDHGKSEFTAFSKNISLFQLDSDSDRKSNWEHVVSDLGRQYKRGKESLGDPPYDYSNRSIIASPVGTVQYKHSKTYFFGITKQLKIYKGYLLFLPYKYLNKYAGIISLKQGDLNALQKRYENINSRFLDSLSEMTQIEL